MHNGNLTWLHLSDFHLCAPRNSWNSRVLDSLLRDLDTQWKKRNIIPDFLFITGDIAFGQVGSAAGETLREQYKDASVILDKVCSLFEIPKSCVFVVPGNHDVNRTRTTPEQRVWLGTRERTVDEVRQMMQNPQGIQWSRFAERQREYRDFLLNYGYTHLVAHPDHLIYGEVRYVGRLKIGIAGINTAWSCSQDGEKGSLWTNGQWQLGTLCSEIQRMGDVDLRIAPLHHPSSWFVEAEATPFWYQLVHNFDFVLHGHEHFQWVQRLDECIVIAAGATCGDTKAVYTYNIVELWTQDPPPKAESETCKRAGSGTVTVRTFIDRGEWVLDTSVGQEEESGIGIQNIFVPNLGDPPKKLFHNRKETPSLPSPGVPGAGSETASKFDFRTFLGSSVIAG